MRDVMRDTRSSLANGEVTIQFDKVTLDCP
jgi:hypothetical protein